MNIGNFLFSFQGRARRRDLWIFFLVLSAIYGGLLWQFGHWHVMHRIHDFMDSGMHHMGIGSYGVTFVTHNPLIGLLGIVAVWMKLAVLVKRWHDRDKSGWFILVTLIPFVGWLWQLVECGFLEGTPGDNRFGPSPK